MFVHNFFLKKPAFKTGFLVNNLNLNLNLAKCSQKQVLNSFDLKIYMFYVKKLILNDPNLFIY